ncbi:MAG: hypothetical protein Q9227_001150 [Pyrenula ochraceoflavens]
MAAQGKDFRAAPSGIGLSVPSANSGSSTAGSSTDVTVSDLYCRKIIEIRETLAQYNQALAHYREQERLPSPSKTTIKRLQTWLSRKDLGGAFLEGSIEHLWTPDSKPEDFMTFTSQQGALASLWAEGLIKWLRFKSRRRSADTIYIVDTSSNSRIAQGISVILSSILPILPIVILFLIKSLIRRISFILLFTGISASILTFGLKMDADRVLAITTA